MRELNIEGIRSVDRAIQIMSCFSFEKPVMSIEELMKKTKLAKATIYRLLWTMERNDMIRYDQKTKEYRLGFRHLEYGGIVLENLDIRREAEPYLVQLHELSGHSVILAIQQGESVQYLLRYDSHEGLQPNNFVGRRRVLHHGALGITMLAYMPMDFVIELLDHYPLEALTPKTLIDQERFLLRLQEIKQQNYYVDMDETFIGYTAIAAPVFREQNKTIAAIGISGASYKMEGERREHLIKITTETAMKISLQMGYHMK
ncbi:MAG: IclR family transcriptional regulator [Paenibacillaceae bacterium]